MSVNDKINNNTKEEVEQDIDSVPLYRKKSAWIGLLLIIIVCVVGVYWFLRSLGSISTDDAFIDGNRLNISPKVLGRIVKLYANERDSVKAGQLIAELDPTDLIARLNQTKAVINNAQVSLDLVKVNIEKAQIDLTGQARNLKTMLFPKQNLIMQKIKWKLL